MRAFRKIDNILRDPGLVITHEVNKFVYGFSDCDSEQQLLRLITWQQTMAHRSVPQKINSLLEYVRGELGRWYGPLCSYQTTRIKKGFRIDATAFRIDATAFRIATKSVWQTFKLRQLKANGSTVPSIILVLLHLSDYCWRLYMLQVHLVLLTCLRHYLGTVRRFSRRCNLQVVMPSWPVACDLAKPSRRDGRAPRPHLIGKREPVWHTCIHYIY